MLMSIHFNIRTALLLFKYIVQSGTKSNSIASEIPKTCIIPFARIFTMLQLANNINMLMVSFES